jgi:hypothetical protein
MMNAAWRETGHKAAVQSNKVTAQGQYQRRVRLRQCRRQHGIWPAEGYSYPEIYPETHLGEILGDAALGQNSSPRHQFH